MSRLNRLPRKFVELIMKPIASTDNGVECDFEQPPLFCEIDGQRVLYREMKSLEEYEQDPNPLSKRVTDYLGTGIGFDGKTYHFWR